jgi:cytochrome c peroxidase
MKLITAITIFLAICIYSCSPKPIEVANENLIGQLPAKVTDPADNVSTIGKVALGKMLFWDPILSGNKDVACASCHHPSAGYAENIELSIGVGGQGLNATRSKGALIKRNAPSVLNTAFNGIRNGVHYNASIAPMFWDNRALSLEEQALLPILDNKEMRGDRIAEKDLYDSLVIRLKNIPEYVMLFEKSFGKNEITKANIGKAIGAFERTLVAKNSKFDRYAAGDTKAMSALELRGMVNFIEAGCIKCHNGPMFSDYKLHVTGISDSPKLKETDKGDGKFAFRTPSLRNLRLTAPYMHNGNFKNLEEVLAFYEELNAVAAASANPNIKTDQMDIALRPLGMIDAQVPSIIAFLNALNDNDFDKTVPANVPSKLHPGGNIK